MPARQSPLSLPPAGSGARRRTACRWRISVVRQTSAADFAMFGLVQPPALVLQDNLATTSWPGAQPTDRLIAHSRRLTSPGRVGRTALVRGSGPLSW